MRFTRPRRAAIILASAAIISTGVLAVPALASASPPPPGAFWVNNAVPITGGRGTSCDQPGYSTIQAAVNAAQTHSSATILVCSGTYVEQVQVTGASTNLTIEPAQALLGVVLQLPAVPANSSTSCDHAPGTGPYQPDQNGFTVCGTSHTVVAVKGLIFDEAWSTSTCDDSLYGILVGGKSTLKLTNSEIDAAGAYPLNGCQGGIGIQDGMGWTTPNEAGHLIASYDRISGYQKNGMTIDGKGTTAQLYENTVTGIGQTTQIAQNGIQVSNGALATITKTTVSGNECDVSVCGPDALTQTQSTGYLLYGAAKGTLITDSLIENNDIGIYYASTNPTLSRTAQVGITDNVIKNNRYEGIQFDQGRAKAAGNRITDGNVGIQFLQYAPSPPFAGQSYGDYDAITATIVKGQSVAAIQVLSDQAAHGDKPGDDTFTNCSISGAVSDNSANYHLTFRS
jgi:hypothetical protein